MVTHHSSCNLITNNFYLWSWCRVSESCLSFIQLFQKVGIFIVPYRQGGKVFGVSCVLYTSSERCRIIPRMISVGKKQQCSQENIVEGIEAANKAHGIVFLLWNTWIAIIWTNSGTAMATVQQWLPLEYKPQILSWGLLSILQYAHKIIYDHCDDFSLVVYLFFLYIDSQIVGYYPLLSRLAYFHQFKAVKFRKKMGLCLID